jgi:hypothetical protein
VEHYRQFWTESFDRLDAYLRTVQAEARAVANGAHAKSRVNAKKPPRARKKQ